MDGADDAVKMGTNDYLASVIIQISEHVHDITNLQNADWRIFGCFD
jgi:hypothetical protein